MAPSPESTLPDHEHAVKPLSVGIVVDNASTVFGGESLIPYHYFRLLPKKGIKAWLVVHSRCREELVNHFPEAEDKLVFLDDSRFELLLYKMENLPYLNLLSRPLSFIRQISFNFRQRQQVKRLIQEKGISLLHQPIPVSPRQPSFLYHMGVPVIIGPLNGGMEIPPGMRDFQGPFARGAIHLGRKIAEMLNWWIPGKRKAALLLAANQRTRAVLPYHEGKVHYLVENGVDLALLNKTPLKKGEKVIFVFVGRLIELKGVHYLIQAYGKISRNFHSELHIIGEGPERSSLEAQAKHIPGIIFYGHVPWESCLEKIRASDVLILPSMMDCGGAAVIEGMACGLPIIATDWGGPQDYIDPECGILIPPLNDEQFVNALAEAMNRLGEDPSLRKKMGEEGFKKVLQEFTWEAKIEKILEFYTEALEK